MYPEKEEIIFYDETFTLDFSWIEKLCWILRRSGIKRKFRCSTRADRLTPEIAKILKSSGFEEVCVGVESGSQIILNNLNKKVTVQQNSLAVDICRKVGLKFKAFIMLGSPGETLETMEETYNWLANKKPDSVGLYMYTPLPGSDIFEHKENYDIEFDFGADRSYYGGKRNQMMSVVSTKALSNQDITKFYWELLKEFGS
jgi:radical SAM superfamily enzyme YgiQ (UPF0313 family)